MSSTGQERPVDGRRLRYQHRRAEILDAVLAHVADHGMIGMSFRTLARAVGVSHVTLRHHFGTKDQLVLEILTSLTTRREPIPDDIGFDDVVALIQELWQRMSAPENDSRTRLLYEAYAQAVRNPDEYRTFLDRITTRWIDSIARHALRTGCPSGEARDFATLALAQLRGLQFEHLVTDDHSRIGSAFQSFLSDIRRQQAQWAQ